MVTLMVGCVSDDRMVGLDGGWSRQSWSACILFHFFMLGAPQGRPEYKAIEHALNVRMLGTSLDRVVPHGWIYEWMGAEVEPNKEWLYKHHCGL